MSLHVDGMTVWVQLTIDVYFYFSQVRGQNNCRKAAMQCKICWFFSPSETAINAHETWNSILFPHIPIPPPNFSLPKSIYSRCNPKTNTTLFYILYIFKKYNIKHRLLTKYQTVEWRSSQS